MFSAI